MLAKMQMVILLLLSVYLVIISVSEAVLEVAEDEYGNIFRLAGGKDCYEGRVEVFHNGQWGSICGDTWDENEGGVVCKMFEFKGIDSVTTSSSAFGSVNESAPIWLSSIVCSGAEDTLSNCSGYWSSGVQDCNPRTFAGVRCSRPFLRKIESLSLRVFCSSEVGCKNCMGCGKKYISNQTSCENDVQVKGFLQAKYRGRWRFVDGTHYTDDLAYVACGMLGYPTNFAAPSYNELLCCNDTNSENCMSKYTRKAIRNPLMIDLKCDGSERDLQSCPFISWSDKSTGCGHQPGKVVTISCGFGPGQYCPTQRQMPMRFASSPYPGDGRVEIFFERTWLSLCGKSISYVEGDVICRQMGFGFSKLLFASQIGYFGVSSTVIGDVDCRSEVVNGSLIKKNGLKDCSYSILPINTDCNHRSDVSIICQMPAKCYEEPSAKLVPITRGRSSSYYVEVNVDGRKGLLCSIGGLIDRTQGEVLCRSGTANELYREFFEGFREVDESHHSGSTRYIGKFSCTRGEMNINECRKSFIAVRRCIGRKLLAIDCSRDLPDLVLNLAQLRLSLLTNTYHSIRHFSDLTCAFEEKCLPPIRDGPDYRYLFRFDTLVMNMGRKSFVPYLSGEEWEWHECHQHYHSHLSFATYNLYSLTGGISMIHGQKVSFCLEDTWYDPTLTVGPYFDCQTGSRDTQGIQGISVGCGDMYNAALDCQWLDVSRVPTGIYLLRIELNPTHNPPESDYSNNVVVCSLTLYERQGHTVHDCAYV